MTVTKVPPKIQQVRTRASSAPTPPKLPQLQPSQNRSSIVDISDRIRAMQFGRNEVILYPPKRTREGGPCYLGLIRLSDGRYFTTGVWKYSNGFHQLRLRERDKKVGNLEDGTRAVCWLEQQEISDGSPHYRSAFYLHGAIYRVELWIRTWGEKDRKVLEVRLQKLDDGRGAS